MTVVMLKPATASWEAIGTTALVRVAEPRALPEATTILDRQLRELDLTASRFREDSELSRLNQAAGSWSPISPLMQTLLREAIRAADLSGGIVDPAIGWAVIDAGYDRDWRELEPIGADGQQPEREPAFRVADLRGDGSLTGPAPVLQALARRLDWRDLEFSADGSSLRMPTTMRLDLGATAKAYAADRAAAQIALSTGVGVLVSLGGDISTAGDPPEGGWNVRVTDDHRAGADAPGQTVTIQGGALATSSTVVRRWRHNHATMHHIIDPRTAQPAAGPWRTVSATAATCVDANIATTTAIVLGEQAPGWLEHAGIAARLVRTDGHVTTVCGWPRESA